MRKSTKMFGLGLVLPSVALIACGWNLKGPVMRANEWVFSGILCVGGIAGLWATCWAYYEHIKNRFKSQTKERVKDIAYGLWSYAETEASRVDRECQGAVINSMLDDIEKHTNINVFEILNRERRDDVPR